MKRVTCIALFILTFLITACGLNMVGITRELYPIQIGGRYGYINYDGKVIITPKYQYCSRFFEGVSIVRDMNGISNIMNLKGECIPIGKDIIVDNFHEGLAKVSARERSGYINKKGVVVINKPNAELGNFSEGFAVVAEYDVDKNTNKYKKIFYYINKSGKNIFNKKFEGAYSFSEGYAVTVQNGQFVIIDKQGRNYLTTDYTYIGPFCNGLALVASDNQTERRYGYINKKGDIVIPLVFTGCDNFNEGYAAAANNGLFGVIDQKGNWVIHPAYQQACSPKESAIPVKQNDKWGFIRLDGSVLSDPIYDDIDIYYFTKRMAFVSIYDQRADGNYLSGGYIRNDGKVFWGKDY